MSNPIKSFTVRTALIVLLIFETGVFANGQTRENQTSGEVTAIILYAKKLLLNGDESKAEEQLRKAEEELQKAELLAAAGSNEEKEIRRLLDIIVTRRAVKLLSEAKEDINQNDYANAKKNAEAALEIAPTGSQASSAADSLLLKIGLIEKHRALLTESRKLIDEHRFEDASKLIQQVLNESKEIGTNSDAKNLLSQTHPTALNRTIWGIQKHYGFLAWVIVDIALFGLVVVIVYLLVSKRREGWTRKNCCRWMLLSIDDKSNMGVSEVIVDCLRRFGEGRPSASVGLLKLQTLQLPTIPELDIPTPDIDFSPVLEALPFEVHGISLASLVKVRTPFRNWFNSKRPWIKGMVFTVDSQVVVRLTVRYSDGRTNTVTSIADKGLASTAAESAAYKMYYLIAANKPSVQDAEGAERLRNALDLLGPYVSGRKPENLQKAYEAFRDVRIENPELEEALLYEGIALDLLEKHDEAITLFDRLIESTSNTTLKGKAIYNRAVSLFREYEDSSLEDVITTLRALIGSDGVYQGAQFETQKKAFVDKLVETPIKALALAAEANAISVRPIFWRTYAGVPKNANDLAIKEAKENPDFKKKVQSWVEDVKAIAELLKEVLGRTTEKPEDWDARTVRQLKWARQNAIGNIYLDVAKYFITESAQSVDDKKVRDEYLQLALKAYEECEFLLPPGVETLTNMGTLLSELGNQEEARAYLDRAITLNRDYEYAYYRKAESWSHQQQTDKVVETLRTFRKVKNPKIREFIKIYQKYATDLAMR
ncbi:MAG: tetratricopeptide repeat protein [Pyrinomonadaceae bacterium]